MIIPLNLILFLVMITMAVVLSWWLNRQDLDVKHAVVPDVGGRQEAAEALRSRQKMGEK